MTISPPNLEMCNSRCIVLKDCVQFSMSASNCQFWKGTCSSRGSISGTTIYKTTWSSKPDLRADRCTHLETHSAVHENVFNCRYKNKKDCADNTLKEPHSCFWTTPHIHWADSECLNHSEMLINSGAGVQTL